MSPDGGGITVYSGKVVVGVFPRYPRNNPTRPCTIFPNRNRAQGDHANHFKACKTHETCISIGIHGYVASHDFLQSFATFIKGLYAQDWKARVMVSVVALSSENINIPEYTAVIQPTKTGGTVTRTINTGVG